MKYPIPNEAYVDTAQSQTCNRFNFRRLFWCKNHGHCPTFKLWWLLNLGKPFGHHGNLGKQLPCLLGQGNLSSPEHQRHFHFIVVPDKFFNMSHLCFKIMGIRFGTNFNLLDL